MNFSLRDNQVVNRIEKRSNGLEKLHSSSVSLLQCECVLLCVCVCLSKWKRRNACQGQHALHEDVFRQRLAITLTSVEQIIQPSLHPSALTVMCSHYEMPQTNMGPYQPPLTTTTPPQNTHTSGQRLRNVSAEIGKIQIFLSSSFWPVTFWRWNRAKRFLDVVLFPSKIVKAY